jgi:hypothetical protein
VHVVVHAADANRFAAQVFDDAADVAVDAGALFFCDQRLPVLWC